MQPEVRRKSAWIAFGIALAASILLVGFVFLPLWQPLVLAAVLATATHHPYCWLRRRLRGRKRLAAVLMTVAIVVLFLLPIAIMLTIAVREAIQAYELVRDALTRGGVDELIARLPERAQNLVNDVVETLHVRVSGLGEEATRGGFTVAKVVGDVVAGITHFFVELAMMLIAYYALLTEGERFLTWVEDVSPLRGQQTIELLHEFRTVSLHVLRSTVVTAAAQAAVATIGYVIAGVSNIVFFGLLTFFSAFVPAVGTSIVAIPLAVILLLLGHTWQGIFLAIWAVAVVGAVDNLLKPLLIRGGMQLHGVIVFFALIGGAIMFGPIGLLLGPLSVTFFLAMIRFGYRDFSPRKPEKGAKPSPGEAPAPAGSGDVPQPAE